MIREAVELDAIVALKMARDYVQETQEYVGIDYDPEYAVGMMMKAVQDPRQLFLISSSGPEVTGMLWGVCAPLLPWSPECIALDQIVYVRPEFRGTRHGLGLISAFDEWAVSKGAIEVRLSVASGIHEEKTGRLYRKLGYDHLGSQYRRKVYVT